MTAIHEFRCNRCKKKATAYFNGEHWLPPLRWTQLYDPREASVVDYHLCDKCHPAYRSPKPPKKLAKNK